MYSLSKQVPCFYRIWNNHKISPLDVVTQHGQVMIKVDCVVEEDRTDYTMALYGNSHSNFFALLVSLMKTGVDVPWPRIKHSACWQLHPNGNGPHQRIACCGEHPLYVLFKWQKEQPQSFVTSSKLMHNNNLVCKSADPSAEFTKLNAVKTPALLMLFLSNYLGFAGLPL